jgi:hypothetical protein
MAALRIALNNNGKFFSIRTRAVVQLISPHESDVALTSPK